MHILNAQDDKTDPKQYPSHRRHKRQKKGHVTLLVLKGADTEATDAIGDTALIAAARAGLTSTWSSFYSKTKPW